MTTRDPLIVERYARGESATIIACDLGVSIQTVYNTLRRNGSQLNHAHVSAEKRRQIIRSAKKGATAASIATALGVSASSVRRVLRTGRQHGAIIDVKQGRPIKGRIQQVVITDHRAVSDVYAEFARVPFPFPEHLSPAAMENEFQRLNAVAMHIRADEIQPRSNAGLKICRPFFPNRYKASTRRTDSAVYAWNDEQAMHKAIRMQLRTGKQTTPNAVLNAVMINCRTPSIFRPSVAKLIYQVYCPTGGTVWDTCCGYGGRLLGAHAAGVRYIGTDVDQETVDGNQYLAQALGADATMHCQPAETFDPPPVDLVFTSPPYFTQERYSDAAEQSWRRYGNSLSEWLDGFLCPVIERARASLAIGKHLILNIADVRQHGKTIPLVRSTITAATNLGFVHVATLQMPLAAFNRTNPTEPVLIFAAA